ncbi:transmembrane channel-like protein [Prorops nasuta]|uniref:transmembrane channel-like protein n=1 Tax=Prorops nasuta TaxID=863751 RepID=UPI0034CECBDD
MLPCVRVVQAENCSIADEDELEAADDEDYSASACAIIQRRSSCRRQSKRSRTRRASSSFALEFDGARRRSSAYTINSASNGACGDTAISMEEGRTTQEQVFEKLKWHKEVLNGVKQQPWSLRHKMKIVQKAKQYVRSHEGALQERLAQRRSTKDVIARISLILTNKSQYFRRELVNLQTWLVPWESRIKQIESHFGSAVASYFTFLRWLFWINLVVSATLTVFVALPEVLTADVQLAGERKIMLQEERAKSKHLMTLWEFEGVLKYSPFFYGWYTDRDSNNGYKLPLAYFVTNLVVYTYSFVAILRKMAKNSRLSKLTEKEDECVFSWKLFTGWDFMIGNPETAHNRVASIVLGFKEALLEEAEKQKDERNWKVILMRIFVNLCVIFLLVLSAYAVVVVVARSTDESIERSWWRQNEITIVMSLISYMFPIFFEILGIFESYHPRKQLRIQLARIMVLNLLNLYSLIFALFDRIDYMEDELNSLKPENTSCVNKPIECDDKVLYSTGMNNSLKGKSVGALVSLSLVALASNATEFKTAPSKLTLPFQGVTNELLIYDPIAYNNTLYADLNNSSEEYYSSNDYPHLDYEYYDNLNISDSTIYGENSTEEYGYDIENITNVVTSTIFDNYTTYETLPDNTTFFENITTSNTQMADENYTSIRSTTHFNDEYSTDYNYTYDYNYNRTKADDFTTISTNLLNESDSGKRVVPLAKDNYLIVCFERNCTRSSERSGLPVLLKKLDLKTRKKLRRLCWETMFGQELAKLTVMDLVLTVVSTLSMDFFRALFIRYFNGCCCWDLEKQFPQYGDFKIAENILHLVNNQGMVWMGMFFSPGLTALNLLKLGILMYLRSWAVLTCNVPHEVVFRASRSNNFYFALLLTMLFLCVLPVGYAIVWVSPSWHCGPFSGYHRIYNLATESLRGSLPTLIQRILDYLTSPGIVIPLIVLMTLIIYYMVSLASSLREANNDLKIQLRHERTEERRKLFKIAEKRNKVNDTPFMRWKKIIPTLPLHKFENHPLVRDTEENKKIDDIRRSDASDGDEITDAEQDSLPNDLNLSFDNDNEDSRVFNDGIKTKLDDNSLDLSAREASSIPEIRINEAGGKSQSIASFNSQEKVFVPISESDVVK